MLAQLNSTEGVFWGRLSRVNRQTYTRIEFGMEEKFVGLSERLE